MGWAGPGMGRASLNVSRVNPHKLLININCIDTRVQWQPRSSQVQLLQSTIFLIIIIRKWDWDFPPPTSHMSTAAANLKSPLALIFFIDTSLDKIYESSLSHPAAPRMSIDYYRFIIRLRTRTWLPFQKRRRRNLRTFPREIIYLSLPMEKEVMKERLHFPSLLK